MTVHTAPRALIDHLKHTGVVFDLLPHPHTESALAEAKALGVDAADVAKTIVLSTPDGFVRAVLPATRRLDLPKVRDRLGTNDVRLATEEVLAGAYPEFELGAVPPLAEDSGDRVLVDERLVDAGWIVFEAGTHEESLRLQTTDLLRLTGGRTVDICED